MKGQYTLVTEVLIFFLGISIATLVLLSFNSIEKSFTDTAITDEMRGVSNLITAGIVKVFESKENTTLILKIPKTIAKNVYRVHVDNNNLTISLVKDPRVKIEQELFNISLSKSIIGDVVSSSEYIAIKSNATTVEIERFW
ncbi:MAG: hypothetical protein J7J38_00570 [Candidatus Aenigmarchaeota archaeon]|nr:hypothetical protein [Candidatus Aenigmarchaeota archaeon]